MVYTFIYLLMDGWLDGFSIIHFFVKTKAVGNHIKLNFNAVVICIQIGVYIVLKKKKKLTYITNIKYVYFNTPKNILCSLLQL